MFRPGQLVAIIGPVGSGKVTKTVFLNIFLIGIFHIFENWVWLCWLGLELGCLWLQLGFIISSLHL